MFSPPPADSLAFSRVRDAHLVWLLASHPATAALLVEVGWFPGPRKARARLHRLAARRVRLVGTVCRGVGRPEHVYAGWWPKPDLLLHEVELTRLCFRLHVGRIDRGPAVAGHPQRPDAVLTVGGAAFLLEFDRGTMSAAQVRGRFRLYADCPHLSLWVCATPERAEYLRSQATALRGTALFASLADAMADPHAAVWRDADGRAAALPREGGRGGPKPGAEA